MDNTFMYKQINKITLLYIEIGGWMIGHYKIAIKHQNLIKVPNVFDPAKKNTCSSITMAVLIHNEISYKNVFT